MALFLDKLDPTWLDIDYYDYGQYREGKIVLLPSNDESNANIVFHQIDLSNYKSLELSGCEVTYSTPPFYFRMCSSYSIFS